MQDAGLVCSLKADYPNFKLDTEFSVRKGELVCIIGPSGCGKSTTLSILSGLLDGDDGTSIILDGNDITRLAPEKRQVALVFQDYAIFPQMNVQDNIAYSLKLQKVPRKERTAKISAWLDLVSLSGFQKRKPSQLSGGERQRVALARALASQPKLLLLDEPLSALDTKLRRHLREEIRRIHDETGVTMVYVTHDQEEAMAIADKIIVMNQGHIEQMGEPEELYHHPKTLFTATFMGDGTTMPYSIIAETLKSEGNSYVRFAPKTRGTGDFLPSRAGHRPRRQRPSFPRIPSPPGIPRCQAGFLHFPRSGLRSSLPVAYIPDWRHRKKTPQAGLCHAWGTSGGYPAVP